MIDSSCPRLAELLAVSRAHRSPEAELDRHLASCDSCRQALAVETALRRAAASIAPEFPSPAKLRFRAERRCAERARARALAPLRLWKATAACALALTLAWLGGALAPAVELLLPIGAVLAGAGAGGAGLAFFALLALAALAGLWMSAVEGAE